MVDIKYQPQLVFSPDFWLPWHGPVQDTSTEAFGSDVAFWSGGFHHRIFFWGKKVETSIFKTTQNFGMGRTFFVLSRLKCPQWILMAGTLRRHKDRRILELNSYQWPVIVDKKSLHNDSTSKRISSDGFWTRNDMSSLSLCATCLSKLRCDPVPFVKTAGWVRLQDNWYNILSYTIYMYIYIHIYIYIIYIYTWFIW